MMHGMYPKWRLYSTLVKLDVVRDPVGINDLFVDMFSSMDSYNGSGWSL